MVILYLIADANNISEDNNSSWDVVSDKDLWEGGNIASEEDYVLVRQDDIVDGIACFMAAYLISLKETKVYLVLLSSNIFFISFLGQFTKYSKRWQFNAFIRK